MIHYKAIDPDGSIAWDTVEPLGMNHITGSIPLPKDPDLALATFLADITWMDRW